jgi:hypothetical protein
MGYELKPRNKKVKQIHFSLVWPIMLQECGMGYILGYGAGRCPTSYVYKSGNNGSPSSNDGYRVSANDAKYMAKVARGYVSVNRFNNAEWEAMDKEDAEIAKQAKYDGKPLYNLPVSENMLTNYEKFADFAEASGGFTIH